MKILFYDGDVRQWCRPVTIRHYNTLDAAQKCWRKKNETLD